MSHPNIRFFVLQVASPFASLEADTTVRRGELGSSMKTVDIAWRAARKVCCVRLHCAANKKSSM
jgi:hypothetical protein